MTEFNLDELYREMDSFTQQIKSLQDGILTFSKMIDEGKKCEERTESLKKIKERLEKELSLTLFKRALTEGQIYREKRK
ncbi:MAG: hypothetical protein IJW93_00085 [Clostridia bacterium]|nr:hypothetical protein [Clostridia bacterium]